MTLKLSIENGDVYKEFIGFVSSKFKGQVEIIEDECEEYEAYQKSEQFLEDREYFHEVLKEIESGEAELIEHDDIWQQIDKQLR